ncbi:TonB-dependent receptor plug domain-containing protein [Marinobacter sp.]|uniref:TonB-dependent receptor plug domain-containing protein n=1 Tax=Marinobacter sp. TaxID=50741 RepID=UPI003A8F25F4
MGGVVNVRTRKHSGVAEGAVSVEGQYNQGDENGNGQVYGLYYSTPATDALSYTVYGNYLDFSESFYDGEPRATKRRAQENYNLVNQFDYALNDQNTLDLEVQLSEENQLGTSMFRGRSYEQERALQSYTLGYGYQSSAVDVDAHIYYSYFDVKYDSPASDITETDYGSDAQAIFFVGQHTVTVGAETRKAEIENTSISGGSTDRTSSAVFAETTLALTDATKLTLGGRFDNDSLFDDEFTYRGYLTQSLTDTWSLKAGAGTAFKAPSMAQISPSYSAPGCAGRCVVQGNPDLSAETGTFSEFGAYYANDSISANATVFYNEVDDIIRNGELPNAPDGVTSYINVDKATLKGLELFVQRQFERVDVDLSYTYMDAEDDRGDDLTGISRHEASLKANWLTSAVTDVFARVKYRSRVEGELGANDVADAYTTLDLGMRHSLLADLDLKLGLNNVTDREISSPDTYTEVLQGRTYYAGLNYSF